MLRQLLLVALASISVGARGEQTSDSPPALTTEPLPERADEEWEVDDPSVVMSDRSSQLLDCGDAIVGGAGLPAPTPPASGWLTTVEVSALWPSYSTADLTLSGAGAAVAPRVSLAWENPDGLGIRARGWGVRGESGIDHPINSQIGESGMIWQDVLSGKLCYSAARLDFDVYQRFKYRRGDVAVGAGITTAYFDKDEQRLVGWFADPIAVTPEWGWYGDPIVPFEIFSASDRVRNVGVGPSVVLEARHSLYESPRTTWSVFGKGRVAELLGQWKGPPQLNSIDHGDANMAIGEGVLGLEYRRRYRYADAFVQGGAEFQSWDLAVVGRFNFGGTTFGAGLNW